MHVFNTSAKFQKVITYKLKEGLKRSIFFKTHFFLFKKINAHLQYVCNIRSSFQVDSLETVKEIHYSSFPSVLARPCKISKTEKAAVLSKIDLFFFSKRHRHIFNIRAIFMLFQIDC